MASESSQSSSSSASADSRSNPGESYIGSFISLISKYEIRYEGVLDHLNLQDSTLGLKNVRSYGTEGRKKDGPQIPASDKVYDYILFRGSDIKDLQVKSPPTQSDKEIFTDPAIIQSHYFGTPTSSLHSASVRGNSFTRPTQWMDTPGVASKPFPRAQHVALPLSFPLPASFGARNLSESPRTQLGPSNHYQTTQNAGGSSFSMPLYMQGNEETASGSSHALNNPFLSPVTMPNQLELIDVNSSPVMGLVNNISQCITHVPSLASNPPYPNFSPMNPAQCSPVNSLTRPSFPPSPQNSYLAIPQTVGKAVSDPAPIPPIQSMPYELPVGTFNSDPLLSMPSSSLAPDQLLQSRQHALAPNQTVNASQDIVIASKPVLSRNSVPENEAPLLPLPVSLQQSQHPISSARFTEEFDFEAMNEKFNKDEVWGYLGKAKQKDKTDTGEEKTTEARSEDTAKAAYKKDDFFDTISCNSLNRGARNVQNRFSERVKHDTETSGNFQRRPQLGYGGHVAGHANYRGAYNSGAGYGYYGRGHGRNTHF